MPKSLQQDSWKKVSTVKDLRKYLNKVIKSGFGDEPVTMYSDEEGNQVNKILCLELFKEGVTIIPWEQY